MKADIKQIIFILLLLLQGCTAAHIPTQSLSISAKNDIAEALLQQHKEWRGTPYQLGGTNKRGIDCSAFSQNIYQDLFSISLPRTTASQVNSGKPIAKHALKSGDLVFFKTGQQKQRHVGIYVQDDMFLHASTSKGVMLSKLSNPYWKEHYWIGVRPEGLAQR